MDSQTFVEALFGYQLEPFLGGTRLRRDQQSRLPPWLAFHTMVLSCTEFICQ
jgi:hypothetical protein